MNSKQSNWFHEHETMIMGIMRWILFGVIVSMLPYLFVLFRNWFHERTVMDYLPDLLLIIFAISAGAINLVWDDKKKICKIAKFGSIAILALVMLWCAVIYVFLFEQTIYNNKLLETYDQLTPSVEDISGDYIDTPEYEKTMIQLITIKSIIHQGELKSEKLKQLENISTLILIAVSVFGIVVEYCNDRNLRKKRTK